MLRGAAFDTALVVGVLALSLAMGGAALARPELFMPLLLCDLWLLAYPHVASTYTRLLLDRASARRHWFLLTLLLPITLAATAGVALAGGVVWLNTVYYHWQTLHYARQSYGIARAYRRGAPFSWARSAAGDAVVLLFALWGIVHRSAQQPGFFYSAALLTLPLPSWLDRAAGAAALASLAAFVWLEAREGRGRAPFHALFVLSHALISWVSFVAVDDVTRGWLFINIWHNAQYLLFVWAYQTGRFRRGVDPSMPLRSWLAQPRHAPVYAVVCVGLGAAIYLALGQVTDRVTSQVLPVVMVGHLAVNFHHYLVDTVIWRRPAVEADMAGA